MNQLSEMIKESSSIVFFGGAGVSTESGIPDFRGADGLYNQKYDYPPERMLSHDFFESNTEEFFRFFRDKMLYLDAKPNKAHKALAALERAGKLSAVVTQNIDRLHFIAGNTKVYELHGSINKNPCTRCRKIYGIEAITESEGVPKCSCGGVIKPGVVLYGEGLDDDTVSMAISAIASCDMLIIAGTSLTVYPAAGFVNYFGGKHLVLINRDSTPFDRKAELVIHEKVGEVLEKALFDAGIPIE